jgi:transcriptional regulator with XRE-family HTH domain
LNSIIDYKLLGERIRKYRLKKGYSQEKLAEIVNISTTFVSRIERGNAKTSLEVLARISMALETTPGYFLSGTLYSTDEYLRNDIFKMLEGCSPYEVKLVSNIIKSIVEIDSDKE